MTQQIIKIQHISSYTQQIKLMKWKKKSFHKQQYLPNVKLANFALIQLYLHRTVYHKIGKLYSTYFYRVNNLKYCEMNFSRILTTNNKKKV